MGNEIERRMGTETMKTDIALIKQKAEFIEQKIQAILEEMASVKTTIADSEVLKKSDLEGHAAQDRWMFGLVIALLLGIFGKMFYG